ncbi:MAG: CopG family transcriptional regulator [Rhodothermaceae bacterium]|nr:MAG: CopG family transcriptional regulator [Rhodothermaceae bacterium]
MNKKLIAGLSALALLAALGLTFTLTGQASSPKVVVYKSPTCGCCSKWVDHMRAQGFEVETHDVQDVTPIKQRFGVAPRLASCHTALVDGYVIEGHVPAAQVKQLLADRPDVRGLAVPGMPMGSPGMEGAYSEAYDVLTFDAQGRTTVFAHIPAR